MICPLLTYADMQQAMAELAEVFQLQIVWFGDNVAEIRWNGGVAVAQADEPEALHGSHVGHGWTYVRVHDPDAHYSATLRRGGHVLHEPHSHPNGAQRGYSARDREGNIWTFGSHAFGSQTHEREQKQLSKVDPTSIRHGHTQNREICAPAHAPGADSHRANIRRYDFLPERSKRLHHYSRQGRESAS